MLIAEGSCGFEPDHISTACPHVAHFPIPCIARDVVREMKGLKKAFKKCENPYRRGVVSVAQFQVRVRFRSVCRMRREVRIKKERVG